MGKKKICSYVAYRCSQWNMNEISGQYIDSEIDAGSRSNGFLQMSGRRDGSMVNIRKPLEMSTVAIAMLLILILAQVAQAGDWPMRGHELLHTGTSDGVVEPPLKLLRNYATEKPVFSSPAISDGIVYVGSENGNVSS